MSAEWNWRKSVVTASESALGRTRRKHPDWFMENSNILMPLVQKKNEAHEKMLQNNSIKNRKEFRRRQGIAKEAVQTAKEKWILQVAKEGERLARMAV